jgi:membrane-associated phospholipid phosphatase
MIRFAVAVLIASNLTNLAAASDQNAAASDHRGADCAPAPCSQSVIGWIPDHESEGATNQSALPQEPSNAFDRRDEIFYPGDTERLKPLGRKLFLNILLDQKEIFSSPFHMNRHTAPVWLLSAATIGGLIAADDHIANAFENSEGQVRWGGRISNIGASYTVVPIVAGFYAFGAWKDHPKAREIGVLGTESLLDSLIVAGVLKEVFRRNRPDEQDPGKFWGGGTSFPSGHAIQMWSIASLLAHEYPHKPVVAVTAYSLATVVSAARIAAQKHFASDVVAGGLMGWFIGRYVYQTHMSHLSHQHAKLVPMIIPQLEPSRRAVGFSMTFGAASSAPAFPTPGTGLGKGFAPWAGQRQADLLQNVPQP